MKDIGQLLLAASTALVLVAVVVFGADDATTLVSPPEQVAEGFVRKVAAGRYELASDHVDDAGEKSLTELRSLGQVMHSGGAIDRVEGILGAITGDTATASALVRTSHTEMRFDFVLVRRQGVWKIAAVSSARLMRSEDRRIPGREAIGDREETNPVGAISPGVKDIAPLTRSAVLDVQAQSMRSGMDAASAVQAP